MLPRACSTCTGTVEKIFWGGVLGAPNFWGRKVLLQPGLCKSPSFACGVPAACHTRAWDAGDWILSGSLSLNRRCFKVVLVQNG